MKSACCSNRRISRCGYREKRKAESGKRKAESAKRKAESAKRKAQSGTHSLLAIFALRITDYGLRITLCIFRFNLYDGFVFLHEVEVGRGILSTIDV